jgi:hypothetical protein
VTDFEEANSRPRIRELVGATRKAVSRVAKLVIIPASIAHNARQTHQHPARNKNDEKNHKERKAAILSVLSSARWQWDPSKTMPFEH